MNPRGRRSGWAVLLAFALAGGSLLPQFAAAAAQPSAPQAGAIAPPARLRVGEVDVMVLVVATGSPVGDLDAIDLKRLFLGIPVVAGGANLRGVLNFSDERLRDLFHEHVMGMTGAIYERRSLELTLEQGRRIPAVYGDETALLALLERDPLAVSFTWRSRALAHPGLRIVRELWHP